MKYLKIERPLVFFDLETTGTDPSGDRIVEISALRLSPDGSRELRTRRLNPGVPIPAGATAVHGIRDEDVADCPSFSKIARGLLDFMKGADLAGFNISRFDIPLLENEFGRCGLDLGMRNRRVLDAMTIYHRKEPRDLSAAVRYFLGREHSGAHGAEADVEATVEVLDAELQRYDDLPRSVNDLDDWLRSSTPGAVDHSGKFVWSEGEVVLGFGRHRGRTLRHMVENDRGYLEWIVRSDFPEDARRIAREALNGVYPVKSD